MKLVWDFEKQRRPFFGQLTGMFIGIVNLFVKRV